jgi:signal transduction histidine kinase
VLGANALSIPQLERQEQLLAAKRQELENLLHVVSHDLKEPLRAIEGFSQLLAARYAEQLDSTGQDFVHRVTRAAARLRRLLDDIRDQSRAGSCEMSGEIVCAREIVDRALDRLALRIAERGARVQIAARLPELCVNRVWAIHAVQNLLSNALKFAPPDHAPEIEIEPCTDDDGAAGLAVLDRGPGVAPEHRERIFALFQRTVGHEIEGTGAGLAIVRAVAARHGGRAWVESRPAGGSKFNLTFGAHGAGSRKGEKEHATPVDRDPPGGGR